MKPCVIGAFSLLLLSLCGLYTFAEENPKGLQNGDFEDGADDKVAAWAADSKIPRASNMTWEFTDSGGRAVGIENLVPNDAFWIQTISGLKADVTYLLYGKMKGEKITGSSNRAGAYLFAKDPVDAQTIRQKGSFDWAAVCLTFTAPQDGVVTIGCRLGGEDAPAMGKAWFDQITLSTYSLRCSPLPPPFSGKDPICKSKIYGSDTYPFGVWIYPWPQEGIGWLQYSVDHLKMSPKHNAPWTLMLAKRDIFDIGCRLKFNHGSELQLPSEKITLAATYFLDQDNDGYGKKAAKKYAFRPLTGYVLNSKDCNDARVEINPNGIEVCNGLDDDCDGQVDEGLLETYFIDRDNDGYGSEDVTIEACQAPEGYADNKLDCDDDDPDVHPEALEYCNAYDDDCDLYIDESCIDDSADLN